MIDSIGPFVLGGESFVNCCQLCTSFFPFGFQGSYGLFLRGVARRPGSTGFSIFPSALIIVFVVALLFYIHGKHLRSCRDGQLI